MCLFWALLQHCWRAHHHLMFLYATYNYSPLSPSFLHVFLAYCVFTFRPWSELKVAIFWPPCHVSLTIFFCLVNALYTSCYSHFWASFCFAFLACLYTDFEDSINCKCAYFWSLFSVVEGNFSVWLLHIPLASYPSLDPHFCMPLLLYLCLLCDHVHNWKNAYLGTA